MPTSSSQNDAMKATLQRILTGAITLLCSAVIALGKLQIDNINEKVNNNATYLIRVDERFRTTTEDLKELIRPIREEQIARKSRIESLEKRVVILQSMLRRVADRARPDHPENFESNAED